jgi:hypothetical protein
VKRRRRTGELYRSAGKGRLCGGLIELVVGEGCAVELFEGVGVVAKLDVSPCDPRACGNKERSGRDTAVGIGPE